MSASDEELRLRLTPVSVPPGSRAAKGAAAKKRKEEAKKPRRNLYAEPKPECVSVGNIQVLDKNEVEEVINAEEEETEEKKKEEASAHVEDHPLMPPPPLTRVPAGYASLSPPDDPKGLPAPPGPHQIIVALQEPQFRECVGAYAVSGFQLGLIVGVFGTVVIAAIRRNMTGL